MRRRARQHGEDRRVGVIVADRADRVEAAQVVLVRRERAMPRDDVERGVLEPARVQPALPAQHDLARLPFLMGLLVGRDGREEVALVREAVRAERAAFGQAEEGAVVLQRVAARLAVRQRDAELAPPRHADEFARARLQDAHLGDDAQGAPLGEEDELPVAADEHAVHVAVRGEDVRGHAVLRRRRAAGGHGAQALDEVGWRGRHGEGGPAELGGGRVRLAERGGAPVRVERRRGRQADEVLDGGADAVEPGAAVLVARRGEGRARELLGVEAEGRALGRVAPDGQRAVHRLGRVVAREARHVGVARLRDGRARDDAFGLVHAVPPLGAWAITARAAGQARRAGPSTRGEPGT